jgi:hypothetical protein
MKRFVASCPVTGVAVIVAVCEAVVVPAEGTVIPVPCPCCRELHEMRIRDAKRVRQAS